MKKISKFIVYSFVLSVVLLLNFSITSKIFAGNLSITPATSGIDNLIGASNVTWRITATTSAELVAGDIIQVLPPYANNVMPFSISNVSLVATSGISLFPEPSSPVEGIVGVQQGDIAIVYGFATTTITSGSTFSFDLGGINNASGQLANLSSLTWTIKGGTPAGNPASFSNEKFSTTSAYVPLIRAGGPLVSDANSSIVLSSYATGTVTNITFQIKATSSIPVGGKIIINVPVDYSLVNATATTQYINSSSSNELRAVIANGAIATTTGQGLNRIILTTSANPTARGDVITVQISGLTNPTTPNVYRSFSIYTAKSNGGLLDGSTFGFEQADFTEGQPMPVDSVTVGGTNNINIQVIKQLANLSTSTLSAGEIAQVKVSMGNPDKGYFAGERWLDAGGQAHYSKLLDGTYMIGTEPFSKGDSSFYDTFLVPAMKSINAVGGITSTTTIIFGVPDATTTIEIDGGVSGQNAFIDAYSDTFQSFSPVYTDTTYTTPGFNAGTNKGYAMLNVKSGQNWNFSVMSGGFGNGGNFTSSGVRYWPPTIPATYVASAGAHDLGAYSYVQADKTLNVTLKKAGTENAITNACVGVRRSGGQFFMGTQDEICAPNNGNIYQFKVPSGSIVVTVARPGFGKPDEYPVGINTTTTGKTIYISSPTSYISVLVRDGAGNGINGAPIFANGSFGFAQGMTGSTGTTTIYVQAGTYQVEGFAPGLGSLTAQTTIVSSEVNPTVTFTADSSSLRQITGQVLQGNAGVAGVKVGARGTGDTRGGGGTETLSNGTFTIYVQPGTYEVSGWSPDIGGLSPLNANTTNGNVALDPWSLQGQGTLRIHVKNSSNVSSMFAGAFDDTTRKGNGTDTWTASTTQATAKFADIKLPAGTYNIHVGSPMTGEITPQGSTAVIEIGGTTQVTYDVATVASFITLSGNIGDTISGISVMANKVGGPGFFSTQSDASGDYSLKVPQNATYNIGVRAVGYVTSEGNVDVIATTTNRTQNFTIITADAAISGTISDSSTASGISGALVFAKKVIGDNSLWINTVTDAAGNYSLSVDSGTWTIYSEGPCYSRSSGFSTTTGSGRNFTLVPIAGCSLANPTMQSMTAASGGQISKDDGASIVFPSNALGTDQGSVSISMNKAKTTACPAINSTPLPDSVQSIAASDSTGGSVSSLNSSADVVIPFDPSTLPVGFDKNNLQASYCDTNTGQWVNIAGTVDTTNNTLTFKTNHLTDFAPTIPGVPNQITNVSATAVSSSRIDLAWDAQPTATEYIVYRNTTDGPFGASQQIASTTDTSYSSTVLTASTRYYYKVAGYNTNGEGFSSASTSAITSAAASSHHARSNSASDESTSTTTATSTTVSTTATTTTASATTDTSSVSSTTTSLTTTSVTVPNETASSIINVIVINYKDTGTLKFGMSNSFIGQIQMLLSQDPEIYPEGNVTGYFGKLTVNAVKKFQKKYGISQVGYIGPTTLAKIIEVYGTGTQSGFVAIKYKKTLKLGSENDDVKNLQIYLAHDIGIYPEARVTGYYGQLTKRAVIKFQNKYGIDPTGIVGPLTRAKLNELDK